MELTNEQWDVVAPLIPRNRRRDGKGRPRVEARSVLDGILWVLWTGAPWRALPSEYPPYQTCHRRLQEWVRDRVFMKILRALAEDLRDRGKFDLTETFVDGTHAGAKRGALSSGLRAVEPQQRSWQWQTAMVFQSRLGSRVVNAMKRSSSLRHSVSDSSEGASSA